MPPRHRDMRERILANSEPCQDTGCWIWIGQVTQSRGGSPRGRINVRDASGKHRKRYAHVVAFEAFHGPVPAGREVSHACECTICVNPSHLEALTHSDNMVQEGARRKRRSQAT
jgi:hypothetical protein